METLKEKLEQIKERVEGGISAQFLKIMHGAIQQLESSGQGQRVLQAGAAAPPFELEDQQGNMRKSDQLLATGPLVLTFYRGFW